MNASFKNTEKPNHEAKKGRNKVLKFYAFFSLSERAALTTITTCLYVQEKHTYSIFINPFFSQNNICFTKCYFPNEFFRMTCVFLEVNIRNKQFPSPAILLTENASIFNKGNMKIK
jgi:hypothetical protein